MNIVYTYTFYTAATLVLFSFINSCLPKAFTARPLSSRHCIKHWEHKVNEHLPSALWEETARVEGGNRWHPQKSLRTFDAQTID